MEPIGRTEYEGLVSEPTPQTVWVLKVEFRTSEETVRSIFGDCVSGQAEGVEFTDLAGERRAIVMIPPVESESR